MRSSSADPVEPGRTDRTGARGAPADLGARAASGFAVMVAQTVGVRAIRVGGNVALAWLLIPEDFAVFALAVTAHQFVSVLKNAGLRDILVQRGARIGRWINPAFWMSVAMGVGGGALLLALAPALAVFFRNPGVIGLMQVLAATTLVQSIAQVPAAMMSARLMFKSAATIEALNNTLQILLTVLMAWAGMGAMSFVLPMLITALGRTAYLWWAMKPRVLLDPQWRRWRFLMGDSARLIGADVARTVVLQGDYIVLGRVFPGSPAIGQYFYAYRLSTQFVGLFARNLDLVLMPALSTLQGDPARHTRAFVRAVRVLATIGMPLCFLQAAMAEAGLRLILPEKFHGAVPFMVVLSVGMAFQLVVGPASAMMRSRGRFSAYSRLAWINAGVFMAALIAAATMGTILTACVAVSAVTAVFGVVFVHAALEGVERRAGRTAGVFALPVVGGGAACLAAWFASGIVPGEGAWSEAARLAVVGAVAVPLYGAMLAAFGREELAEIRLRATGLLGRRLRGGRVARSDS